MPSEINNHMSPASMLVKYGEVLWLATWIWPQKNIPPSFCVIHVNKKGKILLQIQNKKFINYLNPDKKYYDSSYIIELYLPICQMLKVGESIFIFQKL